MIDPKHNPNPNSNHNYSNDNNERYSNDNNERAVVPTPAEGALTALSAVLNKVNVVAVAGHSGLSLMQFKSRKNIWVYGPRQLTPESGSRWALNPLTYVWGYVCFGPDKTKPPLDERLVSVGQPKPEVADLPDHGFPWSEQRGAQLKCLDGADGGVEVIYKSTTYGGIQAITGSLIAVRDRLNGGRHDGNVAPIVHLESYNYQNAQYGLTWNPLLTIIDWMPLSGPAPTPPPPAEQPRRRRVV